MPLSTKLFRHAAALLASIAVVASSTAAQDARVLGCYEVSVGVWDGGPGFTNSIFFRIPPKVNLTTVRSALASTDRVTFVMRAAPGTAESAFEDATWSSDSTGQRVLLRWFAPAFGIQARVKVTEAHGGRVVRFDGEAEQHSDHPSSAGPKATLSLQRVACLEG